MAYCYRHPEQQTGVSCSGCGRPICTDCMKASPVGMRCPECSGKPSLSERMAPQSRLATGDKPRVTIAIIVLCIIGFLVSAGFSGGNQIFRDGSLFGPAVEAGQYWRLISYGFLHAGLLHIFFNMLLLWFLGSEIEREVGSGQFLAIYIVGLIGGAFGALLMTPDTPTVGASGAIYGLMGATAIILLMRGINPLQTGIGALIIINLLLSFVIPGISIGGHIGGLLFGGLAGAAFALGDRQNNHPLGWGLTAALLVVATIASVAVA